MLPIPFEISDGGEGRERGGAGTRALGRRAGTGARRDATRARRHVA